MPGIADVMQTGKKALVAGAGGGVGKGIALVLANFGADMAVLDKNETTVKQTAAEIQALGRRALAIKADVGVTIDVAGAIDRAWRELGPLDILVNNAGYWDPAPAIWTTEQQWDDHLRVNLKSVFLTSKDCAAR